MKTQTTIIKKICLSAIAIVLASNSSVLAQGNTYKLTGNTNGDVSSVFGFKNAADLKAITNDTIRFIVTKDGEVIVVKTLNVQGALTAGSINIPGFIILDTIIKFTSDIQVQGKLTADSAHFKQFIKVGNSVWIGTFQAPGNNEIFSDNGDLGINNNAAFNFNTILHSNNTGRVGIGTQTPQSLLHLDQPGNTPLYTQWTNGTTGNATANDGLRIGVEQTGIAEIRQEETQPLMFLMNDGQFIPMKERVRMFAGPWVINDPANINTVTGINRTAIWEAGVVPPATNGATAVSLLQLAIVR